MAIRILLGTLIAGKNKTPKRTMINMLLFCVGMLITYYLTAIISHGVYGESYIIG